MVHLQSICNNFLSTNHLFSLLNYELDGKDIDDFLFVTAHVKYTSGPYERSAASFNFFFYNIFAFWGNPICLLYVAYAYSLWAFY